MSEKSLVPAKNATILNEYHPPQKLQRFVQVLFSDEVAGNKTEAERRTGVIKEKFYYHLKHSPSFREWVNEQRKEYRVRNAPLVDAQLIAAVKRGDVMAMKLWYLLGGELKTPGLQLNQQFNIEAQSDDKNNPWVKYSDDVLRAFIEMSREVEEIILNNSVKDEAIDIESFAHGYFGQCIRKRPFLFKKILDEALKNALAIEAKKVEETQPPRP